MIGLFAVAAVGTVYVVRSLQAGSSPLLGGGQ